MFLPNLEHETREYALMHLLVLCAKFEYQKIPHISVKVDNKLTHSKQLFFT